VTSQGSITPPGKRPSPSRFSKARNRWPPSRSGTTFPTYRSSLVSRTARDRSTGDPGPSTGTDQTPPEPGSSWGIWSDRQENTSAQRPSSSTREITSAHVNRELGPLSGGRTSHVARSADTACATAAPVPTETCAVA
jgi:hypothetical protein